MIESTDRDWWTDRPRIGMSDAAWHQLIIDTAERILQDWEASVKTYMSWETAWDWAEKQLKTQVRTIREVLND